MRRKVFQREVARAIQPKKAVLNLAHMLYGSAAKLAIDL